MYVPMLVYRSILLGLFIWRLHIEKPSIVILLGDSVVWNNDDDTAAIKANLEEFVRADLSGDWDSFFAQFTEDVAWYWLPGAPAAEGLETMKKLDFIKALEKEFKIVDIDGRGDLGYSRGTFSLLLDHEGAKKIEGNFVTIHRKQPDGSWRIAVNIPSY